MAVTTFVAGTKAKAGEVNYNFSNSIVELGEVRMFALSIAGAVTKANLQSRGWAICDGTTPAAQGISSADITAATPNLEHKFIRMSNDESSGGTGGAESHVHQWFNNSGTSGNNSIFIENNAGAGDYNTFQSDGTTPENFDDDYMNTDSYTDSQDSKPPYYELAFFIKVKYI